MKQPQPKPSIQVASAPGAQPRIQQAPAASKQHPSIQSAVRPQTVPPVAAIQLPKVPASAEFRGSPERLIAVLEKSGVLYAQLLRHAKARRAALRTADFVGFSKLDEPEKTVVAQIAELDQIRLGEARALASKLGLSPDASLADIGERLPPAVGGRLIVLREELRTLVLEVRRESSVVRQAAERLSAHIAGIVQSVHAAIAHANIYSSGGQIATAGSGVISSLDIRS